MLKLTFFNLGIFGIIVFTLPDITSAKTMAEVKQIATASTVKIEFYNKYNMRDNGSGVIYQKQGDIYTIITNAHVACGSAEGINCPINSATYAITTRYQMIYGSAKRIYNTLDLATIKFRSSKNYPLAQFADSSKTINQETIYTAGFPGDQSKLRFSKGKLIASVKNRVIDDGGGYTMLYDAVTLPGMSGGGVFNSQGQIVAIHGKGDSFEQGTDTNDDYRLGEKLGINRGIPANRVTLPPYAATITIDNKQSKASTADEFMVLAYNKSLRLDSKIRIESEKKEALKLVNQAIKLQPNYTQAYVLRGWLHSQLKNNSQALLDYNKAISIDPEYDGSYLLRASAKIALEDQSGALNDYNKAISINPENFIALENRGSVKLILSDGRGALDDFNRASKINNNSDRLIVSIGRCGANGAVGNIKEALQDCNKAIELHTKKGLDPSKLASIYNNLGATKFKSGDKQGALADLNKSIRPVRNINRYKIKW
jgi:tetratricopeptide (TPR) repeat protein